MKKYLIAFILLLVLFGLYYRSGIQIFYRYQEKIDKHHDISLEQIVDNIYGKNGANIDLQELLHLQNLVELLAMTSKTEQAQIAHLVIEKLERAGTSHEIDLYLINYFKKIASQVKDCYTDESREIIAQKIYDYIQFEQANILNNKRTQYLFIQAQRSFCLPELINFWTNSEGQSFLRSHVFESSDNVETQSMMLDMTIMIATQMGATLANEQIAGQAAHLGNILTQQNQTIQANIKSFQSQAQASQQKDLQAQIADFSNKGNAIQTQMQSSIDTSNIELNYLYENISLNKPLQQYLSSPVIFDQIFSQGNMLTPQGPVWRNIFSVGDWEYEKDDDSFYQYQISPIMSQDSDGTMSSTRAENNSIYTEYATVDQSYTISGQITFYQVEYPFFVGIVFNKARWISGNYESLRKERMVGFYGKSADDIGIYFAQQYTMTDEQLQAIGSSDPIQQPLSQILGGAVDNKFVIAPHTFDNLKIAPVAFNFEIITAPEKVTFSFWNDQNSKKSIDIDKLDAQMFTYHGIGFIAPGAVVQFKLNQPEDILFSAQAISKYED